MEWIQPAIDFMTSRLSLGDASLPFTPLSGVLELLLPLLVLLLAGRVAKALLQRWLSRTSWSEEARSRVLLWARRAYRVFTVVLIVSLVGRLFGAQMFSYLGAALSVLREPFYSSGNTEISVVTILLLIPVFYLATWLSRLSRRVTNRALSERIAIDPARRFSISSLLSYGVMGLVVVVGLSVVGLDLSALAVIFGVLGIGLGFGLQSSVANFFAGIVIIFSRPIKEGDFILVNEYEGTVEHIRLVSTVINTITNETIILPNSQIVDNYVHNYSFDDISIVLCVGVQVSYSSDLDRVKEVLSGVAMRNPYAKEEGDEGLVLFRSFDDSGITVKLCSAIRDGREKNRASSWMVLEIWRAFRNAGIEIPFPQRDVHIKSMPPTEAADVPGTPEPTPAPEPASGDGDGASS
ncbi:MAG: mechanosensitive ion channel [Spirochaetes bacterium]|jgi:small-conductance mechanosensitive channel|nr:mechanosensitive ion channel [Spirochaetota bacterium]